METSGISRLSPFYLIYHFFDRVGLPGNRTMRILGRPAHGLVTLPTALPGLLIEIVRTK